MKVKELIKELQNIKDKEREVEILIGNEDKDFYTCSEIDLMHTLDNDDTSVEIFVNTAKLYDLNTYKNFEEAWNEAEELNTSLRELNDSDLVDCKQSLIDRTNRIMEALDEEHLSSLMYGVDNKQ